MRAYLAFYFDRSDPENVLASGAIDEIGATCIHSGISILGPSISLFDYFEGNESGQVFEKLSKEFSQVDLIIAYFGKNAALVRDAVMVSDRHDLVVLGIVEYDSVPDWISDVVQPSKLVVFHTYKEMKILLKEKLDQLRRGLI